MLVAETLGWGRNLRISVPLETGKRIFHLPSLQMNMCYLDPGCTA